MRFPIPLRAPEGAEGGSVPAGAGSVASSETNAAATTQAGGSALGASELAKLIADAVGQAMGPLRTEFVDFRREARNKLIGGSPNGSGATSTPAPLAATPAQWGPAEQLAFRDTIEEAGVSVTVEQRRILETLARAEGGNVAEPIAWVRNKAEAFGWRKAAGTPATPAPATVPVVVAAPKTPNLPAPSGTVAGGTELPDDPALLTESQVAAMTPAEALAFHNRWKEKNGHFRHPWAAAREAATAISRDADHAAAALRKVLAKK